ncbi:triose-phosphate isomerase [Alkalimarinus alittae]|uniref:Triosephosphate isomerase n=1 Tax=Alkalimarinus alittae TaxID=2961619 RepID=A0ABY6N484_9ALTE|nr:triose-phosphate isomerase [Alkalimarinus alittae]UZE96850.1 triose-phosphate isomerase [Alkalimarinus alittae]
MRRKIVAGNWKMNGNRQVAQDLAVGVSNIADSLESSVEVIVSPPYIFMADVISHIASSVNVSSQDVSSNDNGAFTGEISADMLAEFGCTYSIVGHSERRAMFGDTDDVVAAKVAKCIEKNIHPIVCVGETLEERESGKTLEVVGDQLRRALQNLDEAGLEKVIVAYEPVWAIGTGKTATPEQAQEVHEFIRGEIAVINEVVSLKTPIIYGGSVNAENAKSLFAMADIDGGLIGGASLKLEEFEVICKAIG